MNNIYFYIILIIILTTIIFVFFYNKIISYKNESDSARSDVGIRLKKRHNLIPNLVSIVKAYKDFEKKILEELVELRTNRIGENGDQTDMKKENKIHMIIKDIYFQVEGYPELKANDNFLNLQNKLSEIENKLQNSRKYYNGTVRKYNTLIQTFPRNVIAYVSGFENMDFFNISYEESKNTNIDL